MTKLEILTAEIEQNPDNSENYLNRADWYYQLKDFEKALFDYEKAIELGEDLEEDVCYLECLDFKKADAKISELSEKIEKNPQDIDNYTTRAYYYSLKRQYDKAVADISEAINIKPSTVLYQARTILCEDLTEYDLSKAIEVAEDEKKYTSLWFRGNHYKEKYLANKEETYFLEKAEEDYKNAIAYTKNKDSAYFELSRFYQDIENYEEAIEACKIAVETADNNDNVLFLAKYTEHLASLYYETENYKEAADCATEAMKLNDNEHLLMHLLELRADCYEQTGEPFKAFEDRELLEHIVVHHHCHDEHCHGHHHE